MRNKTLVPLAIASTLFATAAFTADTAGSVYMNTGEIRWGDGPPVMPKGAKMAVLAGDPGKEGPFVARLKVPGNYRIAPHWHSKDEDLTVISGTFYLGEGDAADTGHAHAMKAGGFHHLPAKTHHYAFSKGETVVQINSTGPFDITYVKAEDDPSKAMKK